MKTKKSTFGSCGLEEFHRSQARVNGLIYFGRAMNREMVIYNESHLDMLAYLVSCDETNTPSLCDIASSSMTNQTRNDQC